VARGLGTLLVLGGYIGGRKRHQADIGGIRMGFDLAFGPRIARFKPLGRPGDESEVVRLSRYIPLVALLGCGRINYDPVAGDGGSPPTGGGGAQGGSSGGTGGAPDTAAACLGGGGFGAPVVVEIEGLEPDFYGARLAGDGRVLYVSQTKGNPFKDEDIYTVTRASLSSTRFAAPVRLDALNSAAFDGSACPSDDGLELFFSSARPGGAGGRDLWHSRRTSLAAPWGPPVALAEINAAEDDQNPSLSADGLRLYFASGRAGPKGREAIYTASRSGRGQPFGAPGRLMDLASANDDGAPFVSTDGLTIVFSSDRPGGQGSLDVWIASRPNLDAPFADPAPLAAVNSSGAEDDPALSPDGRELFFTSNRERGKEFRIYRALRCP
jgi:WD40-like Beta Propeller Repeat